MSANLSECTGFALPPSFLHGGSRLDHSASTADMDRKGIPGLTQLLEYLDTAEPGDKQLPIYQGEPHKTRELADKLLREHYVLPLRTKSTIWHANLIWKRIAKRLGKLWLHELDRRAVRRILVGPPTMDALTVRCLRFGMRQAQSWGWAVPLRDPTHGIPTRAPAKRAVGATEQVVRDILDAAKSWEAEDPDMRWRHSGAVRLLALTGMRVSEVCSLRWDAIDLVGRYVRLATSKTGPRTVPLSQLAINEMLLLPSRGKSEWVFPSKARCGPIERPYGYYEIRKVAGHPTVRLHDLRHGFATIAADQVRIECVQRALGHADIKQTQHYAGDQLRLGHEASEAVAKRLKGVV